MASLAEINIAFRVDLKQFRTQMQQTQSRLNKAGKQLSSVGRKLSANFTAPILGGLALVTKGTEELRSDLGRLSTNAEIAGESFSFIKDQLKEVNAVAGEVDSSVEGLSNLLASGFKGDNLRVVLESISGAAIKFSDTLKFEGVADGLQETLATGKAVGPFSELLERSGVSLDKFNNGLATAIQNGTQQNFVLQTLASTGLSQVNAKFKENNKDVVEARKSQLNFQLAMADLGRILQPIATRLLNFGTKIIQYFTELSPTTKNFIVVLGGIAAAIGPLLSLAGTILPAIGTGLALLTGPIGLIVAGLTAVGVVIYKNWAPIKKTLIDIANYFIDLYNESTVFRIAVEAVVATFKTLFEIGKFVFEGIKSLLKGFVDSFVTNFKIVGKIFKAVLTGNFKALPGIVKEAGEGAKNNFANLTANLSNDWKNLVEGIQKVTNDGLANVTTRKKIAFLKENVDASAVTEAVSEAVQKGVQNGTSGGGRSKVSGVSGLTSVGQSELSVKSPLEDAANKIPKHGELINENLIAFKTRLVEFQAQTQNILQGTAENFVDGFADIVAGIVQGNLSFGAVGGLILSTLGDLATHLGKTAIKIGLAMKAIKLSFSNPVTAITAGAALLVVGKLIKGLAGNFGSGGNGGFAGSFANGGIVGGSSYYGDKLLARVNSGELILNQGQQKRLYDMVNTGGQSINLTLNGGFEIEGTKLRLVLDRADKLNGRLG